MSLARSLYCTLPPRFSPVWEAFAALEGYSSYAGYVAQAFNPLLSTGVGRLTPPNFSYAPLDNVVWAPGTHRQLRASWTFGGESGQCYVSCYYRLYGSGGYAFSGVSDADLEACAIDALDWTKEYDVGLLPHNAALTSIGGSYHAMLTPTYDPPTYPYYPVYGLLNTRADTWYHPELEPCPPLGQYNVSAANCAKLADPGPDYVIISGQGPPPYQWATFTFGFHTGADPAAVKRLTFHWKTASGWGPYMRAGLYRFDTATTPLLNSACPHGDEETYALDRTDETPLTPYLDAAGTFYARIWSQSDSYYDTLLNFVEAAATIE